MPRGLSVGARRACGAWSKLQAGFFACHDEPASQHGVVVMAVGMLDAYHSLCDSYSCRIYSLGHVSSAAALWSTAAYAPDAADRIHVLFAYQYPRRRAH